MKAAVEALRARDHATLRALLASDRKSATKAQVVVEAGRLGDLAALKLLAQAGADLDAPWRGYRALHALLQEEPHAEHARTTKARLAALDGLLELGANPELAGAWPPARALVIAAFVGSPEFVRCLIDRGAQQDGFTACALGDADAVMRHLKRDPSLATARDVGALTALQCCAGSRLSSQDDAGRRRACAIAGALLDAGSDPSVQTKSWTAEVDAAYFAIGARNRPLVALLLERGADATRALSSAMWKEPRDFAELCLEHGARRDDATSNGKPLLNDLIRWGQVDAALWLLAHGASPDVADAEGWTALHQAASRGNERMLAALLAAGADRGKQDRAGRTAVDVARASRKPQIVALLEAGAKRAAR